MHTQDVADRTQDVADHNPRAEGRSPQGEGEGPAGRKGVGRLDRPFSHYFPKFKMLAERENRAPPQPEDKFVECDVSVVFNI